MKQRMTDHEIRHLLRDLPRNAAPPGFTRDVLRRLDEPREEPRRVSGSFAGWRPVVAAAVLLLALGAGLGLGLGVFGDRGEAPPEPAVASTESRDAARERLEALREEHRRLAQEMEVLRDLTRDNEPFVYLGGDERVDFVYGLDEPTPRQGIEPAAHRNVY